MSKERIELSVVAGGTKSPQDRFVSSLWCRTLIRAGTIVSIATNNNAGDDRRRRRRGGEVALFVLRVPPKRVNGPLWLTVNVGQTDESTPGRGRDRGNL